MEKTNRGRVVVKERIRHTAVYIPSVQDRIACGSKEFDPLSRFSEGSRGDCRTAAIAPLPFSMKPDGSRLVTRYSSSRGGVDRLLEALGLERQTQAKNFPLATAGD
jgi:hypothetical protein